MNDNNHNNEKGDSLKDTHLFYKEEIKKQSKIKKSLKSLLIYTGSLAFCLVLGLAISFSYIYLKDIFIPKYANDSILETTPPSNVIETSNDLVKMAIQNASPSIVSITTLNDTVDWLNNAVTYKGIGSGIIFHKTFNEIFIATNYHVVQNASKIGVAIGDNEPIEAKIIGKDENYDLAVISINVESLSKEELNSIRIGRFVKSDNVKVGDYVIAIGNAVGEGITSTFGIISQTSTDIISNNKKLNVMQTTAAINPGNNGGALINLNGEIIGINTSKVDDNKVESIAYTIGSSVAMPIIEDIMGNLNPTSLGVLVTDVNEQHITYDGMAGGAVIVEIVPEGSADKAGLKVNDVITSINDVPIFTSSSLVEEIKKYEVWDTIKLKIIRNGELKTVKVKLLPANN